VAESFSASAFRGLPGIAEHPWAYPALESVHIAGIALLVGNVVLVELRVWGLGAALPVRPLARLALAVAMAGFGIVVASGLLMFAAAPAELLANRVFVVKMGLVLLAGLNAAWFHARDGLGAADGLARAQMLLSAALWLAVIACGRWIGYV
jgi:hypothetical protein